MPYSLLLILELLHDSSILSYNTSIPKLEGT